MMKSHMASHFFLLLLSLTLSPQLSCSTTDSMSEGSSLSVENPDDILISPSGIFSAGFYPIGNNSYYFAIWFNKPSCTNNCTLVWMANRDQPGMDFSMKPPPVNGKHSKLSLQKTGNLILTDAGLSTIWSTNTDSISLVQLILHDTGNLVLSDKEGIILWQSFDFPTDTLLPLQPLTRSTQLISSRSQTNFSSGFYRLYFNDENLLRLLYVDGPDVSSLYWFDPWLLSWDAGRSTYNSSRTAVLDSLGYFSSSDGLNVMAADYGARLQRRLTIDFDGNVRLYSLEEGTGTWVVSWQAISQPCTIHGACGPNSFCTYDPSLGRKCSCLPGFKMKNQTDWYYGCEPEFSIPKVDDEIDFLQITHAEFYGYDNNIINNYTLDMCKKLCLELGNDCKGFQFKFQNDMWNCYTKTLFRNGRNSPNFNGDVYLKVPKASILSFNNPVKEFGLDCSGENLIELGRTYAKGKENESVKFLLWFACAVGGVEITAIFLVWCFLSRNHKDSNAIAPADLLATTGFKRFTYAELKKATQNFSEEIGRGAGGIVYKGILPDERVAAIKRLNEANQGEAEFFAEVSTIGKLNHMNLIEMWGYCAERKHRLLVYEYMEHGSLAENLFSNSLDWKMRFDIALGTAKGLAYLHEECLEWVLHCDVKPQNILLDSNYQPKVSDFGLSKLLHRGEVNNSSFSKIRGTRGYMAPEWVFNMPITSKVDVYSYGIVMLEMVTGKSPTTGVPANDGGEETEYRSLVTWVREKMNGSTTMAMWMGDIIDPKFEGKYDPGKMEILVAVALQCVEEDKGARPTMSQVVEKLLRYENDY